jgi:hypothetical protein
MAATEKAIQALAQYLHLKIYLIINYCTSNSIFDFDFQLTLLLFQNHPPNYHLYSNFSLQIPHQF